MELVCGLQCLQNLFLHPLTHCQSYDTKILKTNGSQNFMKFTYVTSIPPTRLFSSVISVTS